MSKHNLPNIAERFFRWFCHQTYLEGLEGDLYELFEIRVKEKGLARARLFYFLDMVTLLRPSVIKSFAKITKTNNTTMSILNNYLKTTYRMGKKRMWFSFINIIGLTMGIASVLFIIIYIGDELKYDTHITKLDDKYRIYNILEGEDGLVNYLPIVPPVFAGSLRDNFPQIKKIGRMVLDYGGTVFNIDETSYSEKKGVFAEIETLEILDINLVAGDVGRMDEPKSMLLSENTFTKFFGDVPFENQTIKWGTGHLQVVGIFKNLPEQSHLDLDYIFSFAEATDRIREERMNSWVWQQFYTYLQLEPGTDIVALEAGIQEHIKAQATEHTGEYGFYYTPYLQTIRNIHLHSSNFEWDIAIRGNYQSIMFLAIAALIILLIACLNFVNLTTAQALKRAKEVCVRKFVGARRSQLIIQYGFEAAIYTFLAGLISALLLIVLLPSFNMFTEKTILLASLLTPTYIGSYILFLLMLGVVAGAYPAIVITSFDPLMAVQGAVDVQSSKGGGFKINTRQILVGAQYVLSIGLILISLIIQKQFDFLQNSDMGFNKENLLVIPLSRKMRQNNDLVREKFADNNLISNVSLGYGTPGGIVAGDGIFLPERNDRESSCNMFMVDENYLATMDIQLIAGRDFNPDMTTDISEAFILNETAVRNFGLGTPEDALGETVHWNIWGSEDSLKKGKVIGVIKDFNFKSLHSEMSSTVLHLGPDYFQTILVRVDQGNIPEAIAHLETTYREFEPTRPFEYTFVDQTFKKFYVAEQKLNWLFSLFTFMAIITAGIGLFGLVSFNIISRSKEISIRKVLGASVNSVVQLLVTRYFVLGLICLIVASPAAYYFASQWLNNFSYAINLDVWIFIEVAAITLLFTAATVGFQAYRGAAANPANKLRSE
jgi:putative ABC transport system permease protein